MLPVVLVDPLWWMAARLRRILTGLVVLALALGAAAEARGAAGGPLAEARGRADAPIAVDASIAVVASVTTVPTDLASDTGGAPPVSAFPPAMAPPRLSSEFPVRLHLVSPGAAVLDHDGEPALAAGWAVERPTVAGRLHPALLLADPAPTGAAPNVDERPEHARHAASPGQRAPPLG